MGISDLGTLWKILPSETEVPPQIAWLHRRAMTWKRGIRSVFASHDCNVPNNGARSSLGPEPTRISQKLSHGTD
jgi:hypothetical protein